MDGKYSENLETVYKGAKRVLGIALIGAASVLPSCSLEKYSRVEKLEDFPYNKVLTIDKKSVSNDVFVESKHGYFDQGSLRFRAFKDSNRDGEESFGEDAVVVNVAASDRRSFEAVQRAIKGATGVKVKGKNAGHLEDGELNVEAEDLVFVGRTRGGR